MFIILGFGTPKIGRMFWNAIENAFKLLRYNALVHHP